MGKVSSINVHRIVILIAKVAYIAIQKDKFQQFPVFKNQSYMYYAFRVEGVQF